MRIEKGLRKEIAAKLEEQWFREHKLESILPVVLLLIGLAIIMLSFVFKWNEKPSEIAAVIVIILGVIIYARNIISMSKYIRGKMKESEGENNELATTDKRSN